MEIVNIVFLLCEMLGISEFSVLVYRGFLFTREILILVLEFTELLLNKE